MGATFVSATGGGVFDGTKVFWALGSLDVGEFGTVSVTIDFVNPGNFTQQSVFDYRQGLTPNTLTSNPLTTSFNSAQEQICEILGITRLNVPSSNETEQSAYDIGDVSNKIFQLAGSTNTMNAEYDALVIGCNANTNARDAVFRFSLSEPTEVLISTAVTSWDTVVSLHDQPIGFQTHVNVGNDNEAFLSAQDLGTVNGLDVLVLGADTTGMTADYDQAFSHSPSTPRGTTLSRPRGRPSTPSSVCIRARLPAPFQPRRRSPPATPMTAWCSPTTSGSWMDSTRSSRAIRGTPATARTTWTVAPT